MSSKQQEINMLIKAQSQTPVVKVPRKDLTSNNKPVTKVKVKAKRSGMRREK